MLEITPDQIAELGDEDLRTLIGLLCEADVSRRGLPVASVTWGGDQRAADGGLDVRVRLPVGTRPGDFVPRANTGFQVKCEEMPPSAIRPEMRPSDALRPVIAELADQAGAYTIVSSQDATSDTALQRRRKAMADAVADLQNHAALHLDFYDRTRIASWVRQYPGLTPWVRTKIGRALQGWQGYGAWAYDPRSADGEFLLDDMVRLQTGRKDDGAGLTLLAGIDRLRDLLHHPETVVRLVGLSGVGKTRFVQALFDRRVGSRALDRALAVYANMSDNPDPQPVGMVSDLIAAEKRAIVIVDNCAPELHRAIADGCRRPGSKISAVTIEYDIQEDQPEGTAVFELLPSTEALIERLVRLRFPDVSPPNAETIAHFSGGNARIALALASTIGKDESLSGLADRDLFERLFHQRQEHNRGLLRAAQVCALVYSFEGEAVEGAEAELPRLAALAGVDAAALYASVAELKRRDLVQQRGVWRAVLPHAIANRLATAAFEEIPAATIEREMIERGTERLIRSFSRRLGYLETSSQAEKIVRGWLAESGMLGNAAELNRLGRTMLVNVAPVAPEAALSVIERSLAEAGDANPGWAEEIIELVRSLAWDAALFERCVNVLVALAVSGNTNARDALRTLFQLYLSGTHANTDQRVRVAETLLRSLDPARQQVGTQVLDAMLEGSHFRPPQHFHFGARSRDYGYLPRTADDVRAWYEAGFQLAARIGATDLPIATEVRRTVGSCFRDLWQVGLFDMLEQISRTLGEDNWTDGWIGVRSTLRYDHAAFEPQITERLLRLERRLRPRTLAAKIQSVVLHDGFTVLDFEDVDLDNDGETVQGYERTARLAHELGIAAANIVDALATLYPALLRGTGRTHEFARGLGEAVAAPANLWAALRQQFAALPEENRSPLLLMGLLSGLHERDPVCAEALLDAAVDDDVMGPLLPALQTAVPIDTGGIARLNRALALNRASGAAYRYLSGGRVVENVPPTNLQALIAAIAAKSDGFDAAVDVLFMRLHADASRHCPTAPELGQAARDLLIARPFRIDGRDDEYRLGLLAKAAFSLPDGAETARTIWRTFTVAVARSETYPTKQHGLLKALFAHQPIVLLDEIGTGTPEQVEKMRRLVTGAARFGDNPIDAIPVETFIDWCRIDATVRFPFAARIVSAVQGGTDGAVAQWTPTARALLDEAPDRGAVLECLLKSFHPRSWSGSLAPILSARADLLAELIEHPDRALAERASKAVANLQQAAEAARREETEYDRLRDERFEWC